MKIHCAVIFFAGVAASKLALAYSPPVSVPARLQSPSAEVRQELREVTAKMLGMNTVVLAEDTLTRASQFVFARTPRIDASGQLLQGRVIEQVQVFHLVLREDGCWLTYRDKQNKDQQAKLSLAKCVPE
ncbi:MAG: hypothetical protein V4447_02200 [Pseudomonadota bacterium]